MEQDNKAAMERKPRAWEIFEAMASNLYSRHNIVFSGAGGYSGQENRKCDLEQASVYQTIAEVLKKADV